jgi:hypothetical protein
MTMENSFELSLEALKPEMRLLLCCARTQINAANAERMVKLLRGNIDWHDLLQMAFSHEVAPLLYRNLESIAPGVMPEMVRTELKKQIQVDMQGNLFLTKQLLDLLSLFNQHGIQVIPYKGAVLAASLYHDLALRPFGDLDILVHERDILQAVDVLVSCGYEVIRPTSLSQTNKNYRSFWINQMVKRSPWSYQVILWNPDRQGLIELHWRTIPKYVFPRNPKELWENLRPINVGGVDVFSFAPENLLWFLCLHGAKHQWKRLRWICDIAELVREYPDLNWEQTISHAEGLGMERRLYLGLLLANRLLEMPLSSEIEEKIQTAPFVRNLARQIIARFFDDSSEDVGSGRLSVLAFHLKVIDRIVDRVWYCLGFFKGLGLFELRKAFGSNPLRRLQKIESR